MKVLLLLGVAFASESDHEPVNKGACATTWDDAFAGTANTAVLADTNTQGAGYNALYDYSDTGPWTGVCKTGKHQSPIDLSTTASAFTAPTGMGAIEKLTVSHVDFAAGDLVFVNTGHGVQVQHKDFTGTNDAAGTLGTATYGSTTYNAIQYHIHFPSEHTIDGAEQTGELHIVHRAAGAEGYDDLLVVGVFFELDAANDNAVLTNLGWGSIKDLAPGDAAATKGDFCSIEGDFGSIGDFLTGVTEVDNFYRYEGSLTTPPCTESVHWFVHMDNKIKISTKQLEAYQNSQHKTNRVVQDLNNRALFKNTVDLTEAEAFTDGVRCVTDATPATRACDAAETEESDETPGASDASPAFGLATGVAVVLALLF